MKKKLVCGGFIIAAFILTIAALIGNPRVTPRGPTEDLITNERDPLRIAQRTVETEIKRPGGPTEEVIIITPIGKDARMLAERERELLKNFQCLGLSTIPAPRDVPDPTDPNISLIENRPILLLDDSLPSDWVAIAENDRSLRHFTFGVEGRRFVLTSCFLNQEHGETEIEATNKMMETLLGKSWDTRRFWDNSFELKWRDGAMATGLPLFRAVLSKLFIAAFAFMITVSIIMVLLPTFWVKFGSLRLAVIGLGLIGFALFWTRGLLWWFGINETVFLLIAWSAILCFGQSAILRVFENRAMIPRMWLIAALSIVGFATYFLPRFGFDVLPVRELALTAIIGIMLVNGLAVTIFAEAVRRFKPLIPPKGGGRRLEKLIEAIAECLELLSWRLSGARSPVGIAVAVGGLFIFACYLLMAGKISTETDPRMYTPRHPVVEALNLLNRPEAPGGLLLQYWVRAKYPEIYRHPVFETATSPREHPAFLKEVAEWIALVKQAIPDRGGMYGPFTGIEQGSLIETGEPIPSSIEISADIWVQISSKLNGARRNMGDQLWRDDGFRVIFATRRITDSEIEEAVTAIEKINGRFPSIEFLPIGRNFDFAKSRHYVTEGKINNMISTPALIAICMAAVFWWKGKNKGNSLPWWSAPIAIVSFIFSFSLFIIVMWLGEKPLDIVSATITSLSTSVAIDTVVHLLLSYMGQAPSLSPEEAMAHTFREEGGRIVTDMGFNALGFLPLGVVMFLIPPIGELGFTMAGIMAINLVGTLVLTPPLILFVARMQKQEKITSRRTLSASWQKAAAL